MSKASLADDEPRDGGDSQDMTSKIYTVIRDYGERDGTTCLNQRIGGAVQDKPMHGFVLWKVVGITVFGLFSASAIPNRGVIVKRGSQMSISSFDAQLDDMKARVGIGLSRHGDRGFTTRSKLPSKQ